MTAASMVPMIVDLARKGHLSQAAAHVEGLVQIADANGALPGLLAAVGIDLPAPAPVVASSASASPAPAPAAAAPAAHSA